MAEQITTAQFADEVIGPLKDVGRTLKRYVLMEGLCRCLAWLVGIAAVQFMLDRLLVLGEGPRGVMLLALVGVIGRQFYHGVVRPAWVRIDVNDIAAILERRNTAFRDQLASSVAFATAGKLNPNRDSPALVRSLIDRSAARFKAPPTQDVLRHGRHVRFLGLGLASVVVTIIAFAAAPETMATYIARDLLLKDVAWPASTRIVVEGFRNGRLRWPIGDELTLVATALDKVPRSLRAEFDFPSGERAVREMDRRGADQFILDFGPLAKPMKVRFLIWKIGVDERTDWYAVEAVHRPSVKTVRIKVTPPAYARKQPFVLPQGRVSTDIIRGSRVRIEATLSQPVIEANLRSRSADRLVAPATIEDGTRVWTEFVPDRAGTYFFDVLDASDLDDRHPVTYTFSLIADPPPKVRLTLPGTGELVVANALLNLAVDCEDNLGLKSVVLTHQTNREAATAPFKSLMQEEAMPDFVPGQLRYTLRQTWPLLPLTLQPGDQLTLQSRAADYQPPATKRKPTAKDATPIADEPSWSHLGESLAYTLRVVTAEELLAELGRREHEWRREFEQIIKAQEQINRRITDLRDRTESQRTQRSVRYGQEARTQRQQGGRLKTVLRQFEQIFEELKVNQMAGPAVRRRLRGGVITPLRRLINVDVVAAAELIERLRLQFDEKVADELEQRQTGIVQTMYGILAGMLKWEGYNEAVALLRDIVRMQQAVTKATQAQLEREIEKLFGPGPTPQPEAESEPVPEEQP